MGSDIAMEWITKLRWKKKFIGDEKNKEYQQTASSLEEKPLFPISRTCFSMVV